MEALVTRATPVAIREARGIAETRGDHDVRQLFWALDTVIVPAEGFYGYVMWPTNVEMPEEPIWPTVE